MADNIFSGLARGIQTGQQLSLQRQQFAAQEAQLRQAQAKQEQAQKQAEMTDNFKAFSALNDAGMPGAAKGFFEQKILPDFNEDGVLNNLNMETLDEKTLKGLGRLFGNYSKSDKTSADQRDLFNSINAFSLTIPESQVPRAERAAGLVGGQIGRRAGIEALGEATPSELAQLGAGEDVGEILGRRDGAKETTLENKISTIMGANPDISEQEATGIATGTIRVESDPVTGGRFIVDTITGTEKPLAPEGLGVTPPTIPQAEAGGSLWELSSLATGPLSAGLTGASVISGAVGGPIAQKTAEARQFLRTSQNELIRAMSINPRFPVGEINRLKEEINIEPKLIDNPKLMRARMKSVDRSLRVRLDKELRSSADPNLPAQSRRDALDAVVNISNFLGTLGVPTTIKGTADYNALPSGTVFIDPNGDERRKP